MSTEKIEPTVNPISGLPGALLRQAREDKGLTIEEMSAISNLTKQVIRGIESDEYSELAGLSFVRGYLKLYAKKLGVDEAYVQLETHVWGLSVDSCGMCSRTITQIIEVYQKW